MLKSVQVFWADRAKMPVRAFKSSLFEDRWVLAIFFSIAGHSNQTQIYGSQEIPK